MDVMIAIRSNFFYTRTVPCELWHFDKGKPEERRDSVLMLDARNIYRKVTRKIYDFSAEQLQNLTAIVWLYRSQSDRFIALVQSYLNRTIDDAAAIVKHANAFRAAYVALVDASAPFLNTLLDGSALHRLIRERDDAATACVQSMDQWIARIAKDWNAPCEQTLAAQRTRQNELESLANACRDLVKDVDLVCKLAVRVVDDAEKDADARAHDSWDGRAIGRLEKELDARRKDIVEQLKRTTYFERQAHWLLTRFPDAVFVPVPGLCRGVTCKDMKPPTGA